MCTKNVTATSVNNGCCNHHIIGISGWKQKRPAIYQSTAAATLQMVHPDETQDERTQATGPRDLSWTSKEWFQWAQTLHLSIQRKALIPLTWNAWFSLINNNILMFQLPGLYCKELLYILQPPHHTPATPCLWNSFSALSEMLWPGLESTE